jgi:hypothetical protein
MPRTYVMKPVIKEAIRFTEDNHAEVMDWISGHDAWAFWVKGDITGGERIDVQTHMGTMSAHPGDWIVRGLEGEFYPVQDSKFVATYEEVS